MITLTIAWHELRAFWRSRSLQWVAAVVTAFVLLAAIAGLTWRQQAAAEREVAAAQARERWLGQAAKNPHGAAHFGSFVFAPVRELSALFPGYDEVLGTSTRVEAHVRAPLTGRPVAELPIVGAFGWPSTASLCELLLPLLAIALGHAAFASERERPLRVLLRAMGVAGHRVALGKLLGAQLAVAVACLPMLMVILGLAVALEPSARTLACAAVSCVALLVYGLAWAAIAVGLSALCRSSAMSLGLGFALWGASCIVVPRVASEWSASRHPIVPASVFEAAVRHDLEQGIDGHDPADARIARLREQTLRHYGVERVEDLPINFDGLALQAGEEHSAEVFALHYGRQWDALARQQAAVDGHWWVAPGLALRRFTSALAESDLHHHRALADSVEHYRLTLVRMLNEALTTSSRTGDWEHRADAALWASIPDFEAPAPASLSTRWDRSGGAGTALSLWWIGATVLAAGLGARAQRRVLT